MALEIDKYGFVINGLRHISGKDSLKILEEEGYMLDVRPNFELTRLMNVLAKKKRNEKIKLSLFT